MLTRNFDSLSVGYLTVLSDISSPTETQWMSGMPGIIKTAQERVEKTNYYGNQNHSLLGGSSTTDNFTSYYVGSLYAHAALLVGSGTDEETYYDYKLDIISKLNVVGYRSESVTYTAESCQYTTTKTFINNTDKDVTVNEIGLFAHPALDSDVLLYRKKLGQPVTLKANGGTATFQLEITIPYNKP